MIKRFRAIPWILVLATLQVLYEHWKRVEETDRARVTEIVKRSKGLPHKMSLEDRREIIDIAKRQDHISLGRDLAATATPFPVPGLKTKKPSKAA
jgi:hypothetical protein